MHASSRIGVSLLSYTVTPLLGPYREIAAEYLRYATTPGQTAYERAFDSPYQGKICQFGEVVLAYVKSTKKGAPRWLKGIWLTKTLNHDAHVIALPSAIVCTRSVRRLSNQWDLERCGSLEQPPWEFGLATLGSKLVSAKRITEPATLTYPIGNASGGEEPVPEDEAASDPPSPADITDETTLDELGKDAPQAGTTAQAGQGAEEIAEVVEDSCNSRSDENFISKKKI